MQKKLNIAIMAGGNSSEENISLMGASQLEGWLDPGKYNPYKVLVKGTDWTCMVGNGVAVPVSKDDFSVTLNGERVTFDCALIVIHGNPGENGLLQGYFEMLGIPYTTGGVLNEAITFNKHFCKLLLANTGVKLANEVLVHRGDKISAETVIEQLGLPVFVKPNASGSSYGVSKVKRTEELLPAIDNAFTEDDTVIIEEFIAGRELTCGAFKSLDKEFILPVTEIVPEKEFFDYEAKYLNKSREITPAPIPEDLYLSIQGLTSKIYDVLECRGIVRVDYIAGANGIYFLEVNTVPGMSEASIVPQQVRVMGENMRDMLTLVVEDALRRAKKFSL
jgi:D-alanine-D-alanine ligase